MERCRGGSHSATTPELLVKQTLGMAQATAGVGSGGGDALQKVGGLHLGGTLGGSGGVTRKDARG